MVSRGVTHLLVGRSFSSTKTIKQTIMDLMMLWFICACVLFTNHLILCVKKTIIALQVCVICFEGV